MKKILFIIHLGDIKKSSGIIDKVINQSKAMKENGIFYKTYILHRPSQIEDIKQYQKYDFINFVAVKDYEVQKNVIKKIYLEEKVYKEYINICKKEKDNYDYIYVRYNPLYQMFIKFTRLFKNKIIFEHNSIEITEYMANKNKLYLIKEKIFGKYVRNNAKHFVAVSNEIYEHQSTYYKNKKGIVIPNGIDVSKYNVRIVPKYDKKRLNMVFVGNIRYWHGLERIISSIDNYKGNIDITLNICGDFNQKDYLTPLLEGLKTKHKINMLGYKNKEELDKYFNEAHIAVGTLGCYKKNINYASVLKNREYFSRAIPIVFSEIDDDICTKENEGLYLKVKNDASDVDMNTIIEFVEKFYKNSEENTKRIRRFAENKLDYNKKILKLKELINEEKN